MIRRLRSNRNQLVPFYIAACFSYFEEGDPLISNQLFDKIALALAREYHQLDHHHKQWVSEEEVKAAVFLGQYPATTHKIVENLRRRIFNHV